MESHRSELRDALERLFELARMQQTDSSEFAALDRFVQTCLLETYADTPELTRRVVA